MPASVLSLLWSTFSPRGLVLAGNKFHVGGFFCRVLQKYGPTTGLSGRTRHPSLYMLWPGLCGSAGHHWLNITQSLPGVGMNLGLGKYKRRLPAGIHRQLFLSNVWRQKLVWRREDGSHLPLLLLNYLEAS